MIWRGDPYVRLMASLPRIGFLAERTIPISRERLQARLTDLEPEDAAELAALRALLDWESFDLAMDDARFLAEADRLIARLRHPAVRAAVLDRLEMRTIVAALRRRRAGLDAPAPGEPWGHGPAVPRIRADWTLPDFGLGRGRPWIAKARERLEAGDTPALERLLLETAWDLIRRREAGHEFDFAAVAFYLMRWSIADRWSRYDADAAAIRFAELLDAALAGAPGLEDAA